MAALVAFAVLVDLRGSETELAPFAGDDVPAGALLTDSVVDWREVPRGLLPPASLEGKVTAHAIGRGEPITQTALTDHQPPPDGWWSVELPLPDNASPGRAARVVVSDPPMTVARVWSEAGFTVKTSDDVTQMVWEKLICNAAGSRRPTTCPRAARSSPSPRMRVSGGAYSPTRSWRARRHHSRISRCGRPCASSQVSEAARAQLGPTFVRSGRLFPRSDDAACWPGVRLRR